MPIVDLDWTIVGWQLASGPRQSRSLLVDAASHKGVCELSICAAARLCRLAPASSIGVIWRDIFRPDSVSTCRSAESRRRPLACLPAIVPRLAIDGSSTTSSRRHSTGCGGVSELTARAAFDSAETPRLAWKAVTAITLMVLISRPFNRNPPLVQIFKYHAPRNITILAEGAAQAIPSGVRIVT